MAPHPQYSHSLGLFDYLIDQAMFDIDTARIRSAEISDEFFITGGILKRIRFDNLDQLFCFFSQPSGREVFRIFLRLFAVEDRVLYHSTDSLNSLSGAFIALMIDCAMVGIEVRYNVSSIAFQSSWETITALWRLPVMMIGSWLCAVSSMRL